MGLVKYALKFRNSFFVLSLLMIFLGGGAIITMPKDIFRSSISRSWPSSGPRRASPPRRWNSG